MTRYKIQVTEKDIRRGKPKMGMFCPVFRAAKRVLGRRVIHVDNAWIAIRPDPDNTNFEVHVPCPFYTSRFITKFDNGEPVKPFKFSINLARTRAKG